MLDQQSNNPFTAVTPSLLAVMDANEGKFKLDVQRLQQIKEYRVETTVNVEHQLEPVCISPEITAFLEE